VLKRALTLQEKLALPSISHQLAMHHLELAVDVAFTNEIVLRKNLVSLTSVAAIALENEGVV
jgi:hypothetical protein